MGLCLRTAPESYFVMLLSYFDRLMLQQILPPEGDFISMKIVRDLRMALSFSEEEIEVSEIKFLEDGQVRWKAEGAKEKEVEIGKKATAIIVEALEKLNKDKKLTSNHLAVYEKFIESDKDG